MWINRQDLYVSGTQKRHLDYTTDSPVLVPSWGLNVMAPMFWWKGKIQPEIGQKTPKGAMRLKRDRYVSQV